MSLHEDEFLKMETKVTTEALSKLWPNFEEVYGESESVKVLIKSTESPLVMVGTESSTLTCQTQFTIMNPLAEEDGYEAVILSAEFTADVVWLLRIDSNRLTFVLKNPKLTLKSMDTLFHSKVDMDYLNTEQDGSGKRKSFMLAKLISNKVNN